MAKRGRGSPGRVGGPDLPGLAGARAEKGKQCLSSSAHAPGRHSRTRRNKPPYRPATSARCRAAFVRFPQIRIEHHWLDRLRERS